MARLHAGTWMGSYDCSACRTKPGQMKVWGCDEKMTVHDHYWPMIQDGDDVVRLSSCPFRYVPYSIIQWMREYVYHKNFPSAPMPGFADLNPNWSHAMSVYENEYSDAIKEKPNG